MATGKRYYWMKLKDSFMTSDAIDFLMSQQDGANYVVLYQILCLKTINTRGRLSRQIGEVIIPYDEQKIARDSKYFSVDTVRVALHLYKALGLVYEDADGTLALTDHDNLVGSETDWAEKRRRQRLGAPYNPAIPACGTGGDNGGDIVPIDIRDRDKEIDIRDRDIEKRNKKEKTDVFSDFSGGDDELLKALLDFEAMRKTIKKPLTPRAKQMLVNKLQQLSTDHATQIEILNQSIFHNWQGVFPLKNEGRQANGIDRRNAGAGSSRVPEEAGWD